MATPKDGHGNKALKEGKQLESKQDELLTKTDRGTTLAGQKDSGKRGAPAEHAGIGGRYFDVTPDESARIFEKKNQILEKAKGHGWMASVTDQDAKRLIRQEQRLADAQYEDWLARNFVRNMDNPSDQAWAQRTFPSYFEKRKKVIEDFTEIQKKIALMQLTGPQNEDDLKLLYMWNAGLITVPQEAVHKMDTKRDIRNQFVRGRFNVRRLAGAATTDTLTDNTSLSADFVRDNRSRQQYTNTNDPALWSGASTFGIIGQP